MIVAELWAIIKPFTSPVCLLITAFLFLRILQRIYYLLKGHCHLWNYSPRAEIAKLWRRENIRVVECCAQSSSDGTIIHYQRIGSGEKVILHSNGVGTDFFLWLNFLQHLLQLDPHFFEKYTILAATHRGLFVPDKRKNKRVNVTLQNCATDVQDVMRHAGVEQLETFIGWSTGAQVALACCTLHPAATPALFLFNTSLGHTLHGLFQPVLPLPLALQRGLSSFLCAAIHWVRPVVDTDTWDTLKGVATSPAFWVLFEALSFLNGFPPEQAMFFHEYNRDIFFSRAHTHALLDLIQMVDEPLPDRDLPRALHGVRRCVCISGFFDFITGVYESQKLHDALSSSRSDFDCDDIGNSGCGSGKRGNRRSKHVMFSMGSHFLLLEWPELVAQELIDHLRDDVESLRTLAQDSDSKPVKENSVTTTGSPRRTKRAMAEESPTGTWWLRDSASSSDRRQSKRASRSGGKSVGAGT